MSEASKNMAINVANGILELEANIQSEKAASHKLQQELDNISERLIAAQKGLRDMKDMTQSQRGMRYEDMNVMVAYADQAIAVAEGRAPVAHLKKPYFSPRK